MTGGQIGEGFGEGASSSRSMAAISAHDCLGAGVCAGRRSADGATEPSSTVGATAIAGHFAGLSSGISGSEWGGDAASVSIHDGPGVGEGVGCIVAGGDGSAVSSSTVGEVATAGHFAGLSSGAGGVWGKNGRDWGRRPELFVRGFL